MRGRLLAAWVVLSGCAGSPGATSAEGDALEGSQAQPPPIQLAVASTDGVSLPGPGGAAPLAHLEGCWTADGADGAHWRVSYTRPMAGVVLGSTRQLRGEELVLDEFERFSVQADGTLVVVPIANGVPRDVFAFDPAQSQPGSAVFQRRGEGFPQSLTYRRGGPGLEIIARDEERAIGIQLAPGMCF